MDEIEDVETGPGPEPESPLPPSLHAVLEMCKAVLTAARRKKLKPKQFALPGGRYPIHDEAHARNALARVAQFGTPEEQRRVRAAVRKRYPKMGLSKAGPGDPAGRLRITKAEVTRLSLCRRAKNGLRTLYKSDDGSIQIDALVKAVDEGTLLAVMYAPERPDADGHLAGPEVVRGMLHSLMRNGAELDIEHDGKVLSPEQAYVAEAFTVQKGDPRFADWKNYDGTPAGDLTGAAAVQINIDDPVLRASRARGDWDGISLFGVGEGVPERVITKSAPQEDTMTPEQLKQLTDSFSAGLAALQTALVKSVTDLVKPGETQAEGAASADAVPAFEGDPTDPAALESYEKALRAHELRKAVSSGKMTADQIAELRKSLSESGPTDKDAGIEKGDSKEVRDLKLRLFKAQRRSNAPASGERSPEKTQIELDVAEGLELAKALTGEASGVSKGWNVH